MSLIDEALKRARLEAAQRAAEGEGLPYPTIPRHLAPRRRPAWLAPAAVVLAVVGGVLVGLLVASGGSPAAEPVVALRSGSGEPAVTPLSAPEPESSAPSAPAKLEQDTTVPALPALPEPDAPQPVTSGPTGPEQPTRDAATPTAENPPLSSARPAAPQAAEPPPAPTTVTDPDSGVLLVLPNRPMTAPANDGGASSTAALESYTQRYPLPGGGVIELGGIAWSETGPFALINGRVVGPGSVIEAYTLERIRPGHVVLTGDGRQIQLSLH